MTTLAHIAEQVINRPLFILPEKLAIISEVLAGRIAITKVDVDLNRDRPEAASIEAALAAAMTPDASRFTGDRLERDAAGKPTKYLPYARTPEGVAIATVTGSLVNRGAWIGASSGLTSYEGIAHQVASAVQDPKVKAIILDIESPGGQATGMIETGEMIRKAGEVKPIYAIVNGMAASAAYGLASGAKAIISTPSGVAGSIGVVLLHADYSRALDRAGITPTLIYAGAHKVDGNPYAPLSRDVADSLKTEIDQLFDLFVNSVAAGRGRKLSAKAAKALEARTFIGAAAKDAGLVDDIGSFSELLAVVSRNPGLPRKGV